MQQVNDGIAMLSAVLRSDEAIQVSVNIMNTFVKMRRFLAFPYLSHIKKKEIFNHEKRTDYSS